MEAVQIGYSEIDHLTRVNSQQREKKSISTFIQKTFNILQEKHYEHIISWVEDSMPASDSAKTRCSTFKIHDTKAFEEYILPKYFKHSNLSSFVRQLNMYNFHKIRGDKNEFEFEHEKFRRGHPELLCDIKRKQSESVLEIMPCGSQNFGEKRVGTSEQIIAFQPANKDKDIREVYSLHQIPERVDVDKEENKDKKVGFFSNESIELADDEEENRKKLSALQEENRQLKKVKEQKQQHQKSLNSASNKQNTITKFSKVILSLFVEKLRKEEFLAKEGAIKEVKEDPTDVNPENCANKMSMEQLIEHVIDCTEPMLFQDYRHSTKDLIKQRK